MSNHVLYLLNYNLQSYLLQTLLDLFFGFNKIIKSETNSVYAFITHPLNNWSKRVIASVTKQSEYISCVTTLDFFELHFSHFFSS